MMLAAEAEAVVYRPASQARALFQSVLAAQPQ